MCVNEVVTTFEVFCDRLLISCTATWILLVLNKKNCLAQSVSDLNRSWVRSNQNVIRIQNRQVQKSLFISVYHSYSPLRFSSSCITTFCCSIFLISGDINCILWKKYFLLQINIARINTRESLKELPFSTILESCTIL